MKGNFKGRTGMALESGLKQSQDFNHKKNGQRMGAENEKNSRHKERLRQRHMGRT